MTRWGCTNIGNYLYCWMKELGTQRCTDKAKKLVRMDVESVFYPYGPFLSIWPLFILWPHSYPMAPCLSHGPEYGSLLSHGPPLDYFLIDYLGICASLPELWLSPRIQRNFFSPWPFTVMFHTNTAIIATMRPLSVLPFLFTFSLAFDAQSQWAWIDESCHDKIPSLNLAGENYLKLTEASYNALGKGSLSAHHDCSEACLGQRIHMALLSRVRC